MAGKEQAAPCGESCGGTHISPLWRDPSENILIWQRRQTPVFFISTGLIHICSMMWNSDKMSSVTAIIFDASEYGFVLTIEIQDASFADCCSLIRVQGGQFEADHLQISDPTKVGIVSFNWSDQSETGLCWNVCAFPCLLEQMQAFACSQDTASKSFQPTEENSSID